LNLGNNSGSTVLYLFNYTASLTLNNNIFVNTSVPSGFASTEILYSMLNNSTFYSSSSNRNLFYIGPPQNNRHIARFGGNIYSTMSAFKAGVSPRDAQSVTENPPFITTDGNLPNTLAISPLIGTQIESGAAPF